jgi:hypothetical protein
MGLNAEWLGFEVTVKSLNKGWDVKKLTQVFGLVQQKLGGILKLP